MVAEPGQFSPNSATRRGRDGRLLEVDHFWSHTNTVVASDLRDTDPIKVGDVLIVGRLGEGGMGVVYLGRGPGGGAVAVKVVRDDLARDPEFRRRFAEEVEAMRDVGAAYAAGVISANTEATPPWVVMEYVQGMTLGERVGRAGPLPEDELRAFAIGLVRAVAAIHAAGVVHRDLKPSNVVLSPQGVRLLDFGVAKSPAVSGQLGERVGSLTWMAPEQLNGKSGGSATDVHAIGMLLYYAASGRHIYGYGDANAVAWRISHIEPQLIDLPPEARGYVDLITAALAKDPGRRPTLKAIYDRLRADDIVRAGHSTGTTAVDQVEAEATAVVSGDGPPPPAPLGQPQFRPRTTDDSLQPAPPVVDLTTGSGIGLPRKRGGSGMGIASGRFDSDDGDERDLMSLVESTADEDELPPPRRWRTRIMAMTGVLALAWTLGWASGVWPLAGPLAPASAVVRDCYQGEGDANFAAGTEYAQTGSGEVSRSLLGAFPGPLGEYRVPTRGIACEIGQGVTLDCPEPTLPDRADLACTAWDASGGSTWVTIVRTGDTWKWTLRD
ncbi:MAG: eukaryotic-like serine/threonine-protein kinase [Actinomycetota bacterium]|nr:eukaryotic-like serine/threonine-protein kinase [Actinomycetota bacterium]